MNARELIRWLEAFQASESQGIPRQPNLSQKKPLPVLPEGVLKTILCRLELVDHVGCQHDFVLLVGQAAVSGPAA
ncbi:MAG TPA: hypothetical protein VMR33_10510, partial [Candidatus Baltobacteraceae bacterium]|nr:hypothetical protein [Candidatus Baltobacteraceae bacterium]